MRINLINRVDALPTLIIYLLSLIGGVLSGLAYAPFGLWPCAIGGIAMLVLLVRTASKRRSFCLGYVFGMAMMAFNSAGVRQIAWWIAIVLVSYMALWLGLIALAIRIVTSLSAWPIWVASVWVGVEYCYARFPFGGFGWARLAYTTPDQPLGGFLPVMGAAGVSWLVAFSAAACVWLTGQRKIVAIYAVSVVSVTWITGGVLRMLPADTAENSVTIGMVQGNVDGTSGPRALGYARSVTNNHYSETVALMAAARSGVVNTPDFILWPENSADLDPHRDQATRIQVTRASKIAGRPILVGAITDGPGEQHRQTTSIWWSPQEGETARYSKRNRVPFGEFTPFQSVIQQMIPITNLVGRQSVPGQGPGVLSVVIPGKGNVRVGTIICYELAFDSTVYDVVKARGQVITVQSNNATYTGSFQPHQQFAITRVRAMEMRREIVIATTSSFSGMIDTRGRVIDRTRESTAVSRTYSVPLREGVSLGVRVGPWWEILSLLVAFVTVIFGIVEIRNTRKHNGH